MNTIFRNGASIPSSIKTAFTDHILPNVVLPKLNAQQQKIAIIGALAIGLVSALFITLFCSFCNKKPSGGSPSPTSPPVPSQTNPKKNDLSGPSASSLYGQRGNVGGGSQTYTYSPDQGRINHGGLPNLGVNPPNFSPPSSPAQDIFGRMLGGAFPGGGTKPVLPPNLFGNQGGIHDDLHDFGRLNNPKHKVRELSEVEKIENTITDLRREIEYEQQLLDVLDDTNPQSDAKKQPVVGLPKKDETGKNDGTAQQPDQSVVDGAVVEDVVDAEKDQKNASIDATILKIAEEEGEVTDPYAEGQMKIITLTSDLNEALEKYPEILRLYLEDQYKHRKDNHDIFERLTMLEGLLDVYKQNEGFVEEALILIDLFLTNVFFTSPDESCLPEEKKIDVIVFHVFFTILNQHIGAIQDREPELALKLKIKLANLPLHKDIDRASFSNIYLTEREQLNLLIVHFQKRETEAVDLAIQYFAFNGPLNMQDVKRLARFVTKDQSPLAQKNVEKIRGELQKLMGKAAPKRWDDKSAVREALNHFFNPRQNFSRPQSFYQSHFYNRCHEDLYKKLPVGINALHLACQAKRYFEDQMGKPDDEILLPRWYHATDYPNVRKIVKSKKIKVLHRQAFNGAWVSDQREPTMGDCTFVFTHNVSLVDPNVFIGYENGNGQGKVRWRGLQNSIPLDGFAGRPTLAYVGLKKTATKTEKKAVLEILQRKGFPITTIFRNEQVDYIRMEILRMIGNPNLTEKWWGKANLDDLERPLTK
jgi:hypothetical protein